MTPRASTPVSVKTPQQSPAVSIRQGDGTPRSRGQIPGGLFGGEKNQIVASDAPSAPKFLSLQKQPQSHDMYAGSSIDHSVHGQSGLAADNLWVTVFGFPREETEQVMNEFKRIGEVTQEIIAGENYVHLRYANIQLKHRALDKNHKEMRGSRGSYMIGVKEHLPEECTDEPQPTGMLSMGQQMRMRSEFDAHRTYLVQNDDIAVQRYDSVWSRLGYFVFGA